MIAKRAVGLNNPHRTCGCISLSDRFVGFASHFEKSSRQIIEHQCKDNGLPWKSEVTISEQLPLYRQPIVLFSRRCCGAVRL